MVNLSGAYSLLVHIWFTFAPIGFALSLREIVILRDRTSMECGLNYGIANFYLEPLLITNQTFQMLSEQISTIEFKINLPTCRSRSVENENNHSNTLNCMNS